ncbi:response regulator transcription factor [Dactylosporangium sp. CA-139066]|uniref:response regulator transcription factor n=1 Tax=Dactylosporangium sp. CA-139066 TaxID=3239930 RepID=UPI003D8DD97C
MIGIAGPGVQLPRLEGHRGYIVAVDDDPDLRALMAAQLARGGYEVATAADGPAAIALIQQRPPDAVVLDVAMPGMSGVEVCRQLRNIESTVAVPIVMLTARTQVNFEMEGRMAGADAYLAKPYSARTLLAHIEDLLLS